MKVKIAFYITLGVCILCMSSLTGNSYATSVNNAGTICKNYNASEATDIDYLVTGVRNVNASSRFVICPVVHSDTGTSTKIRVFVDGFANSGTTISCTLYGVSPQGAFNSQASGPMTLGFDPLFSIQVNSDYTTSVLCSLPGSGGGIIYDLNVLP